MQTKIYNQQGKETGTMELAESVFGLPINRDLIQQLRVSILANLRKPVAHTKDRSDVRGGGRKPWRQKGTGRARHGSRRSPIWKGGGVSHGPRNDKIYSQKINSVMAKVALKNALSSKFSQGQIKVIDDISLASAKSKDFVNFMKGLSPVIDSKNTTLFVTPKSDTNITRASKNIPRTKVVSVRELNLLDILKFKNIIFTASALEILNK